MACPGHPSRVDALLGMSNVTSQLLPVLLLPRLPAVMKKFPFRAFHSTLPWIRVMVMLRFLSRAQVFLAFPPPLLCFALNLPCRLTALADALSGTLNCDLFLLLQIVSSSTEQWHDVVAKREAFRYPAALLAEH
jgi:hypothetical protein